jgi:transposase-like protein
MVDEEDMKAALAAIESQGVAQYRKIAREHKLVHTTLLRRWKGQTRSRADFQSEVNQNLTNEQERLLVKQINRLTERHIPPTSQMVKNFAEEMIGRAVGKNWASDFCYRHQSELKSVYLRNIEHLRVKGEYGPTYKLFFDLVECFFALLYYISHRMLTDACFTLVTTSHRRQSNYCRQYL